MKKYALLVLILLPLILFAQTAIEESGDAEGTSYGIGGMVGSVTIGDNTYSQIRLMPEIVIWKFGFGLDIDLLIDSEGKVRKEDWDEARDIINKIYYIRFAQRRDPFYFKVGSIPDYTLGHGLIFDGYSNMLRYPEFRNIGGYVGVNTPYAGLGFEAFTHNVEKNEILAGRVHAKPLSLLSIPFFEKLIVGVNVGVDRNQFGKYEDKDGDDIPDVYDAFVDNAASWLDTDGDGVADDIDIDIDGDNALDDPTVNPFVEVQYPGIGNAGLTLDTDIVPDLAVPLGSDREIYIYSADYELPLIESRVFSLSHYAEYAMIRNYGSGFIFPGFGAKLFIFDANLEFRSFGDEFLPGYFDKLYDEQRSNVLYTDINGQQVYSLIAKEEILSSVKASMGWYGSVKANIANMIFLKIAYQDMYGEDVVTGKSIWGTLGVDPKIIPNLKEASVSYSQTNVEYIALNKLRSPSAEVSGRMAYGLSSNTFLVGKYTERYIDLDANGKIQGTDETVKSMTFGVEFKF
ncbi:MAG: hypothetical protein CVU48_00805 [Candidatus Cloacimonetes bacterium HGW-Cloacimonetes-1]|jgi:hypothetical protein|nr:MAG: hypothetical protein CVU48_00805 [Candidatus Cloacimonetes bacterium HGW-Cloacimonetes-1]